MKTKLIFIAVLFSALQVPAQEKPEIEWVSIPEGFFTMGSPEDEYGRESGEIRHNVTISAFSMSKYEITFEQYDKFCEATKRKKPNDAGWGRGNRPVINVSWSDAEAFAKWMKCRLPTEAEWEYACRAGTVTPFSTGDNILASQANYDGTVPYKDYPKGELRGKTLPAGSFEPNAWGLCDMHGNVWEWCSDWFSAYTSNSQNNPKGPKSGHLHIGRGGSWKNIGQHCRSAYRYARASNYKSNALGFRLVKVE